MIYELGLYPVISNKIVREKDQKSIKERKRGFWERKDAEGNVLIRTQRGFFLNNKNISVISAESFVSSSSIRNVPRFHFYVYDKITKEL